MTDSMIPPNEPTFSIATNTGFAVAPSLYGSIGNIDTISIHLQTSPIVALPQTPIKDNPMTDQDVRLWALETAYHFLLNFTSSEMDLITGEQLIAQARVFESYVRIASEIDDSKCSPGDYKCDEVDYGLDEWDDDKMTQAESQPVLDTVEWAFPAPPVSGPAKAPAPTGRQHAPLGFDPLRCGKD